MKTEKHPDTAEKPDPADESEATADDGVVEENPDGVADSDDAVEDSVDDVEDSVDTADEDDTDADQELSSVPAESDGRKRRSRRLVRTDTDQDESSSEPAENDQDESSSEPAENKGGKRRLRRRLRIDADQDESSSEPAENTDADQDESSSEPAETKGGRRRRRRLLRVAGVCLLFVAPVAASAFLGWLLWQNHQVARAGEEAQKAAVAYAQVLTSIDSNKVDENFAQVLDGSTGEFKDMYSKSSMQLRQLLIDNKATAHGVVVDSAIKSEAKNKVVVLLFVDQAVTNTNVPDPRIDRSRIKMTMEYVDGRWRASKIELA